MSKNPEHRYINDRQVSELTGRGLQTLRNDRARGQGIPYTKFGRLVRYRVDDVVSFMEQHKVTPQE